jgi:hypothetical protein
VTRVFHVTNDCLDASLICFSSIVFGVAVGEDKHQAVVPPHETEHDPAHRGSAVVASYVDAHESFSGVTVA